MTRNTVMLSVCTECRYAECRYAECRVTERKTRVHQNNKMTVGSILTSTTQCQLHKTLQRPNLIS
jgi:hypothetical protein